MKPMIYYRIKEYIFHIGAKWDKKAVKEENAINFAHKHINAEPENVWILLNIYLQMREKT